MEFVVIVLFVAAILLVNFLMDRARKKRHEAPAPETRPEPGRQGAGPAQKPKLPAGASAQTAREAARLLEPEQHRQVYAAIAQGQAVKAVKLYAQFTGSGLRAASVAVTSLAAHPQPQNRSDQPPASSPPAASPDAPSRGAAEPAAGGAGPAAPAGDPSPADRPTAAEAPRTGKAGTPEPAAGTGPAKAQPETPLPDDAEISRWAQNLRPEDF